jgi:hypothetical protein
MKAERLFVILAMGLMLMALPSALFGQSCSLCYTQAAASTQRFIQALRSGILILMLPPFVMSVGITWMTYSRRNNFHAGYDEDPAIGNVGTVIESDQDG